MIGSWKKFKMAVKRRETPFHDRLYRIAKGILNPSLPCIRPLHRFLYAEWALRTSMWHNFWRILYYEPMFKSRCASVGKGFQMVYAGNGCTRVLGDPVIHIGDNVTIFDNTYFVGLKVFDEPMIRIGDNSYIGPRVRLYSAKSIEIGRWTAIQTMLVTDNPGHPMKDPIARMQPGAGSPPAEDIRPVKIGDFCVIPMGTFVYPGTEIGDGVVARVGTHVSRKVPPFVMIAGNPWKIIKKLPIPPEIEKFVGPERYRSYLEAHKDIVVERAED